MMTMYDDHFLSIAQFVEQINNITFLSVVRQLHQSHFS